MTKYQQIKYKLCLPVIYIRAFLTYILAYALKAYPRVNREKIKVMFGADATRNIIVLLAPTLILLTIVIGGVIQLYGKYWQIWIWILMYLFFAFDYIWMTADEEKLLVNAWKSIPKEKKNDTSTEE